MTEGQGLAGAEVAVCELLEIGDIGATDPRRAYGDLKLACGWLVDGPKLLYGRKSDGGDQQP